VYKKLKLNQIIVVIKILLINILIGFFTTYFFNHDFSKLFDEIVSTILYSLLMGTALWTGNTYVSRFFYKSIELKSKPLRKFILGIIVMLIYTVIAVILVEFLWFITWEGGNLFEFKFPDFQLIVILVGVTFIVGFALTIKEYITEKKKVLIREEKLKTEIIKLQYETLKNQVNPHFLFNSLNALTSLVAENDEAVEFIKNLADVYRYVLEHKDKELVDVERELAFVSAYLYLHQIRFGKNLEINICKAPTRKLVAPLAVQMLVENAIKHNEISFDSPLKIVIFEENNFLVVENNLQLKSMVGNSSKIGLENIKLRYSYLTDIPIVSGVVDGKFIVKIPLMEVKK
jgi:sensor histidine kinase YesM